MKVIERSPVSGASGQPSFGDRIRGIWQFGLSWDQDLQAQQVLLRRLGKVLDNTYTAICNVALPEFALPVPVVLIGPTGVRTFYVSAAKGIFQIRDDQWYALDNRSKHYKPSRPNLPRRAELMSRAVIDYLKENGYYVEEKEAVLFFANPGIHVESNHTSVHLLYSDGAERFAASLLQEKTILDSFELQRIPDILMESKPAVKETDENMRSIMPPQQLVGVGDIRMRPWQWLVIFVLAVLMLIIIILSAYIVINLS